jgi:ABC-2 type transport system permease protein
MNIFWHELKAYRTSTFIWALSLSLIVFMFFSIFQSFTKDVAESQKLLTNLPVVIRTALDISIKNFFTIYGFFGYLLTFVTLAAAIQASNLGVGVLSKEDSGKTADFLLAKPVSRFKVVTSKIMAALTILVITNLVFDAVAMVSAKMVTKASFDSRTFLLLSAIMFFVQLFFLALGLVLSVIIPKVKSAITVSLPVVFGLFIFGTLGAILGNDNVRYFSPFKFFDTNYVINNNGYETKFLLIEAAFVLVAIIVTYIIYLRKDVRSAS